MASGRGRRVGSVIAVLVSASLLAFGCTSTSPRAHVSTRPGKSQVPVSLPTPQSGEVTFYLSLPSSAAALDKAAVSASTPGSPRYRHFSSLGQAARQFGATNAQISTVAAAMSSVGLRFAADPTRLFGRVTGSTQQWKAALGVPLSRQAATASSPFVTYSLPASVPDALQPAGTRLLVRQALVYDPAADGRRQPGGERPTARPRAARTTSAAKAAQPWPFNAGTPLVANCSSPLLQQRRVYTEQQVQIAYGIDQLRAQASGTPVITVVDLGGGWLPGDLKLAGSALDTPRPR